MKSTESGASEQDDTKRLEWIFKECDILWLDGRKERLLSGKREAIDAAMRKETK